MKFDSVHVSTAFICTIGDTEYRRVSENCWEIRMGESWETCFSNEAELEAAFVEYRRIKPTFGGRHG